MGTLIEEIKKTDPERNLKFISVKPGNTTDIHVVRYKKKGDLDSKYTHNFWYSFINKEETVLILGELVTRKEASYAYNVAYAHQGQFEKYNTPLLFIFGVGMEICYCLDLHQLELKRSIDERERNEQSLAVNK
jgi:hypothetical protein